jgi:hypothetical protein
VALFEPDIALNFQFVDCALFALLMEAKNPTHILDVGSYFGMLPILSEQLHWMYGDQKKFNWTLVDDCSYVKEIANYFKGIGEFSGTNLRATHRDTFLVKNTKQWKQVMFEIHGDYCIPPVSPSEFNLFWDKFTNYYKLQRPSIEMHTALDSIPAGRKFDLVMFDLAAESYDTNLLMFQRLLEIVSDDAIIVMDDLNPAHPKAMALFQYIIDTTDFSPLAFSNNKIAIQRKKYKQDFIFTTIVNAGLYGVGEQMKVTEAPYYMFFRQYGYKWEDYIVVRPNH